jgi:hypothetical protein
MSKFEASTDQGSVVISEQDFLELLHFARRYCDGRMTSVPSVFNAIYDRVQRDNPALLLKEREDVVTKRFPYAHDPFSREERGAR